MDDDDRRSRTASLVSCIVCSEEINGIDRLNSIGSCNHAGVCSICSLRLRQLLNDRSCILCKATLDKVIVTNDTSKAFEDYVEWNENHIGPSHVFDEASRIYFPKTYYQDKIIPLREFRCPVCSSKHSSLKELKTHVVKNHQRPYCTICLEHKKQLFIQEHELFKSQSHLARHIKTGNGKGDKNSNDDGFTGHPSCDFCPKHQSFYSKAELFKHLNLKHYDCDLCTADGILYRYYRDYNDLENHFREEHFLCEEPSCLEQKFKVFKDSISFAAHMKSAHPELSSSSKNVIQLGFNIKRANRDGTGLSAAQADVTKAEARELRRRNYQDDEESEEAQPSITVADFPALEDNTTNAAYTGGPMNLGWGGRQPGAIPSSADFPTLGGASSSSRQYNTSAFRNAVAPPPTIGMQAHNAPAGSWEYPKASTQESVTAMFKPARMKKGKKKFQNLEDRLQSSCAVTTAEEEEKASSSSVIESIKTALQSQHNFSQFKEICQSYRVGGIRPEEFYLKTLALFKNKEDSFRTLFPKLMSLLPDERLQAPVMKIFIDSFSKRKQKQNPQKKNRSNHKNNTSGGGGGWKNALAQSGLDSKPPAAASALKVVKKQSSNTSSWKSAASVAETVGMRASATRPQGNRVPVVAPPPHVAKSNTSARAPPPPPRNRNDFPGLPSAAAPIGRTFVTRSNWDDEAKKINDSTNDNATTTGKSKKKKKNKKMGLKDFAMQFK